jgi:hypothetical protein
MLLIQSAAAVIVIRFSDEENVDESVFLDTSAPDGPPGDRRPFRHPCEKETGEVLYEKNAGRGAEPPASRM